MRVLALLLLSVSCGCTQIQMLPYLDQVMTLKDFGEDKKAQEDLVLKIDAGYDRLQKAIADGKMDQYKNETQIIKVFGPPIINEHEAHEDSIYKKSLYRYTIQSKSPTKVHIFYDKNGKLVKWESLN